MNIPPRGGRPSSSNWHFRQASSWKLSASEKSWNWRTGRLRQEIEGGGGFESDCRSRKLASHRKPALPGQRPEFGGGRDHAVEHGVSGAGNRHLGAAVRDRRQPDLARRAAELESHQPGGRAMYGTPASALPRHGSGRCAPRNRPVRGLNVRKNPLLESIPNGCCDTALRR
jgi:hypothetical protein